MFDWKLCDYVDLVYNTFIWALLFLNLIIKPFEISFIDKKHLTNWFGVCYNLFVKEENKLAKRTKAIIILDGLGESERVEGNAVKQAHTPTLDWLRANCPHTLINASGMFVGLADGQMGNSEVGHMNIGSGRVIYQDSTAISKAILDGDFFTNSAFLGATDNCKKHNSALHIVGLVSSGGVHSKLEHLFALIDLAKRENIEKLYIHIITDGRDTPPTSGEGFIKQVKDKLTEVGIGKIATICGRYNIMDRDNRWERVKKGYDNLMAGKGEYFSNPLTAIKESYNKGLTDEFVEPIVIGDYAGVNENDSIIFFNYRTDRAREITRSIIYKDFNEFEREGGYKKVFYVCMTQYDASFVNCEIAFPPRVPKNTLGEYLSNLGLSQGRVAETEKYAHVTFFFNGGIETPFKNEERVLVNSPKVATYDLQPEMSAYEVTDKAIALLDNGIDCLILNYANPDMVGHTGKMDACVKAVQAVDECLGKLLHKIEEIGGSAIVTADHGNAEQMLYEDGSVCTSHTTNLVPLFIFGKEFKNVKLKSGGKLGNIAPTLLEMMKLEKPKEMTEDSLFI